MISVLKNSIHLRLTFTGRDKTIYVIETCRPVMAKYSIIHGPFDDIATAKRFMAIREVYAKKLVKLSLHRYL
jgi:hypothetical protein